jgi:hypothetical protein
MANEAAIECGDLRVVFRWRGDRYGHTVERRMDGTWRTLLESIEGSPDDAWPPSPALQTVHIERRPGGPVALLVGQAGSSHWSASVDAVQDHRGLVFDLACRIMQRADRMGSAYRVLQADMSSLISFSAGSSDAVVSTHREADWTISPANVVNPPATAQWRYLISATV